MSPNTPIPIGNLAELLAYALEIEREATARYEELADQMEVHHNTEVAALFHRLAGYEREHAQEIAQRIGKLNLPVLAEWEYRWVDPESPEAAPYDGAHYLMTVRQALELALVNERRARDFYEALATSVADPEARALAAIFVDEERQHVQYVEEALAKAPPDAAGWNDDLDPASAVD
jgi:rubrerythrin